MALPAVVLLFLLLGIDGLRQDVLYDSLEEQVQDPNDSFYVTLWDLSGIGQVLGGIRNAGGDGVDDVREERFVKLQSAVSVFPSITLASWASIFTGELPGKTGQLGNEFFARDLLGQSGVPAGLGNPNGVVSYSSGSFPGYDTSIPKLVAEFIPMGSVEAGAEPMIAPQNRLLHKPPGTVYERISEKGGRTVVVGNHYSRGADLWLTQDAWGGVTSVAESLPNIFNIGAASGVMDRVSKSMAVRWLEAKKGEYLKGGRFPDLFVYYTGGVDHAGHDKGLGAYKQAFLEVTDREAIAEFVDKLKEVGQFYNKVYLITSDHGHTEMAGLGPVVLDAGSADERTVYPDQSCSYNAKGFGRQEIQEAEQANNNLHVWELGNLLTLFPSSKTTFDLLAPKELKGAGIDTVLKEESKDATVMAALNGPMAHIYVRGDSWASDPDPIRLAAVTDRLLRVLKLGGEAGEGDFGKGIRKHFFRLMSSIDQILVRRTLKGQYEVVMDVAEDVGGNPHLVTAPLSTSVLVDGSKYVNGVERVQGMNHESRSGDIVLLFKSDVEDTTKMNRYTSGVSCKSWHGSLNRTDSYVPFIVSYPGGNAIELDKPIEDVCPGKQCAGNWKATDLIKKIIELQYSGK